MSRATTLEGSVVDPAGKPVAGADLFPLDASGNSPGTLVSRKARPDGTFRIPQVDPTGSLAIRARSNTTGAVTNGAVVVRMREQQGPIKITIDPRFTFRMHGTVADRAGKPIEGAEVTLFWQRQLPSDDPLRSGSTGSIWKTYTTDKSGRFDTGTLFPEDTYSLNVTAKGYAPFHGDEIVGVAGLSRRLGTIKLAGTKGFIAGRVVGSDGKPIAGVTVFNRGNGLAEVSTRTDAQGRFRLDGLFPGRKYAFASKEGYRFTGTLVDGDRGDLTIRLLRNDEPPPAWKPAQGTSQDEDRELAKHILTRLWEISGKQDEGPGRQSSQNQLILAMARVDPALALDWSAQQGGHLDAQVKLTGAEVIADYDARAAIDVIRKAHDRAMALEKLIDLANWYADSDPVRARLFAEEAAATIKTVEGPQPSLTRARLGAILFDLGRKDEGKKLVEEAVAALSRPAPQAKLGAHIPLSPSLLITARALARFDLKRAQKLADSIQEPYFRAQMPVHFALAIARTD
ncbi:MAG: carboxypeptidase regulatory-like domain-containing protein, partial [Isosphaeraceae bacterium]